MGIAAELCIYTNDQLTVETIAASTGGEGAARAVDGGGVQ
jgi:hypothetical protein